ncbi:MAG: hypothetical protein M0Z67_10615 [Nitrospiraceae bacterium]|nr:hypothetical protein [Nitrospiraceae bacterium]
MPYLSVKEFETVILNTSPDLIVEEYIFQGKPYVFRKQMKAFNILTKHLVEKLGIVEKNIIIVGSAKMGFSLNPENFPRQFSDASDIDVVIISDKLFDIIWMTLLKWNYPRRLAHLGQVERDWQQYRRKEIFYGWLMPNEIRYEGLAFPEVLKPLRDLSAKWFNTFQSLSLYPEFAARIVMGRLYRSREHALRYHAEGLRQIYNKIVTTQKGR